MSYASSDVTPVADAYEHALFAKHPRDEYAPGNEILLLVFSVIPPLILKWLLKTLPYKRITFAPAPIVFYNKGGR